ncbi:ABC transporter permease [Priestia filamentosa]|uniref:ABC transporter permease n=1 Tax=Priestia filamentosa TaxID=1402861 RepID=UPI001FB26D9E|nr:ABC transporter permease [Priestia filamentosa]UOE59489.1 ABC transporter permease [Priestia filamentosa]
MTFRQFAYKNVTRNLRTYAAYFLSSAFSVMIFFVYALFIFNPYIQQGITVGAAIDVMKAAEYIIFLFSFFFVLYSMNAFLKTRKREFGILMMHGMSRYQLNRMVFLENMLIGIGAIITGILFGLLTAKLFLMMGAKAVGITNIPFYFASKAFFLTVFSFLGLFFVISLVTSLTIRTKKLLDLFQESQKVKEEPKNSIILSLIGLACLITAYYLPITAEGGLSVLKRFFPAVILTIIGTYFFFSQTSIFIINLTKKQKYFFFKKTNIITIASLAYRLKENARMFFMVTIVSTVSICAIGTLASFNTFAEQIEQDYPYAISYIANGKHKTEQKHVEEIKQALKEKNLDYTAFPMPILIIQGKIETKEANISAGASIQRNSVSENRPFAFISQSNYIKYIEGAGDYVSSPSHLNENEALIPPANTLTKTFMDESYMNVLKKDKYQIPGEPAMYIKDKAEHILFPPDIMASDTLIVNDAVYKHLLSKGKTEMFTGFNIREWKETAGLLPRLAGNNGIVPYNPNKSYSIAVSGNPYAEQMKMANMLLFVSLLVGAVFFIAAGSFLYFRLYADLDYDKRQYATVAKVGLTEKELSYIVTKQLLLLFFIPLLVATIHSTFAFAALQDFFALSILKEIIAVLISFFIFQTCYFIVIRTRYLKKIKRSLI